MPNRISNQKHRKKGRLLQEAKVKLYKFLKNEYSTKKALEARLIQLKPNVILKKGTMLPNLIIKMQGKIQFLVYLDYGDQTRIYFFDQAAQSLGAENYPKSDDILKDIYGKAKTLLKLPKSNPLKDTDQLSSEIQTELEKRIKRTCHNFNFQYPGHYTISTSKNLTRIHDLQIGMERENNIIYVNKKVWQKPLINFFYDREVFLSFQSLKKNREFKIFLATLYSLIRNHEAHSTLNKAFQKIKKYQHPIIQKAWEWMNKRIISKASQNNQNLSMSEFLLISTYLLANSKPLSLDFLFAILCLWLMMNNSIIVVDFLDFPVRNLQEAWILSHFYELLFKNPTILVKYHLSWDDLQTEEIIDVYWYQYFLSLWKLKLYNPNKFSQSIEYTSEIAKIGIQQEFIKQFSQGNLLPAQRLIPVQTQKLLSEDFHKIFQRYFLKKLLQIQFAGSQQVNSNDEIIWKISIKNSGDWILRDIEYHINISPPHLLKIIEKQIPKATHFDTTIQFLLKFQSFDQKGEVTIKIEAQYQNPFNLSTKTKITFFSEKIKIE